MTMYKKKKLLRNNHIKNVYFERRNECNAQNLRYKMTQNGFKTLKSISFES